MQTSPHTAQTIKQLKHTISRVQVWITNLRFIARQAMCACPSSYVCKERSGIQYAVVKSLTDS